MDARSIAATAANKGFLTSAEEFDGSYSEHKYYFDKSIYENRVFDSKGVADPSVEIQFGPVSYTHLDVYKRQVNTPKDKAAIIYNNISVGAVSYTHLSWQMPCLRSRCL